MPFPDGRFVIVPQRLWEDEKFLALSTEARLLFMWSWMPPHATVSGLFRASVRDLIAAIGQSTLDGQSERAERLESALNELWDNQMMVYRDQTVWVVKRVQYAVRHTMSEKGKLAVRKRMADEWRLMRPTPWDDEFLAMYGQYLGLGKEMESVRK